MIAFITLLMLPFLAAGEGGVKTEDVRIRDPFIVPLPGGEWLLTGTTARDGFLGRRSRELATWSAPFRVFKAGPDLAAAGDFWAPEIHAYGGRFYLLGSIKPEGKHRGTWIFAADHAEGPYAPHSRGAVTPESWDCLDGTLFVDEEKVPWMVFCHEWTQVVDGEVQAVRLRPDLSAAEGEPILLFRASSALWADPLPGRDGRVTDGPFLYRTQGGTLLLLWSSFRKGTYVTGMARSASGKIAGPWTQDAEPIYSADGGHPMLFRGPGGELRLTLHAPNSGGRERLKILVVREEGDRFIVSDLACTADAVREALAR
jgi:arabinan endo-1,5-alpha-L-arabinosidase